MAGKKRFDGRENETGISYGDKAARCRKLAIFDVGAIPRQLYVFFLTLTLSLFGSIRLTTYRVGQEQGDEQKQAQDFHVRRDEVANDAHYFCSNRPAV